MEKLTIITNNVPRNLLCFYDLTLKEQADFDYVSEDSYGEDRFFRYRGVVFDSQEFETITMRHAPDLRHDLKAWDAFQANSFFAGTVIRYVDHFERIVVGRYIY